MAAYEVRYTYPGFTPESIEGIRVVHTEEKATHEEVERIFRVEDMKWRGTVPLPRPKIHSIVQLEVSA